MKEKIRDIVARLPHQPGIYMMKDRLGSILYIGKAKDLKKRVSTYFQPSRRFDFGQPKLRGMIPLIHDIEIRILKTEAEALLLEGQMIKKWKPRYNTDLLDDKRFLMVRVDVKSEIPKFRLTRVKNDPRSQYFGPFVHSQSLRKTLWQLRLKFGIVLADAMPLKLPDGRYQLYTDARAEIYGHPSVVSTEAYHLRVTKACAFLEGKSRKVLDQLTQDMFKASEKRDYEKAASLRDQILALRQTLEPQRRHFNDPTKIQAPAKILERLRDQLGMDALPAHMECFDISHISGTFVVASMVHFSGGRPDKARYRRYRIRSFEGNDDYRSMEEVVARRYGRLHREGKPFPDLIIIDGGAGQVQAALRAFLNLGLAPPFLIGLAKKQETIIFSDGRKALNLPLTDPALNLLQRIRDEAHRFANDYNAELRSKRIGESILDDIKGLGKKRKELLLKHFKSIQVLRKASPQDIEAVEGISANLAQIIYEFLNQNTQVGQEE